jgi:hypothetical protein
MSTPLPRTAEQRNAAAQGEERDAGRLGNNEVTISSGRKAASVATAE